MKPISVVVMDNLMGDHIDEVTSIYDLKGSTHRRLTKKIKSNRTVRKDLNILVDADNYLQVDEKTKKDLVTRLYNDKEFLKSCNLMDYSLLLIFFKQQADSE